MENHNNDSQQPQSIFNNQQLNIGARSLPNATTVLVLGILSLVLCYVGWIVGIIALVLANKDKKAYELNPGMYSDSSYGNIKTGKVCSIIGVILQLLFCIGYAIFIWFFFKDFPKGFSKFD